MTTKKLLEHCLTILQIEKIERFRDARIKEGFLEVKTKTGGINRAFYKKENESLILHELYHDDSDIDDVPFHMIFRFKLSNDLLDKWSTLM